MLKKIIWLLILGAVLIYILPKVFFQLSIMLDQNSSNIQRVVIEDDSGLLLPPEFDTLPEATNSANLVVHGFSQNATEIELFINDISKTTVQVEKEDGSFKIRNVHLFQGKNILTMVARDRRGNASVHSDPVQIQFKHAMPKLIISHPEEDALVSGEDRNLTITGLTDLDSTITINGRWIRVHADGTFTHQVSLSDGENEFKISARDEAGNEKVVNRTVTYSSE
jgi:bacillopeptidase F